MRRTEAITGRMKKKLLLAGTPAILCGPVLGYALVGDPPVAWNNLRFGRAIRLLAPGRQTTLEQAVLFS